MTGHPVEPTALDGGTERAVRAFLHRLEGRFAVRETILFGSRARQTHRTDSDADLAIILDGPPGRRSVIAREMAGIAFDVMLDTDVLIDPHPVWAEELDAADAAAPRLLRRLRRDGLRLSVVG